MTAPSRYERRTGKPLDESRREMFRRIGRLGAKKTNRQRRLRNKVERAETIERGPKWDRKNPFRHLDRGKKFLRRAVAYAERAIDDTRNDEFNIWVRLAAERFLNDLERAKDDETAFRFSEEQGDRACRFMENLPHVEGKWPTPNIQLVDAQAFFLVNLFGFRVRDDAERRRFTTALFAVARKNAKSTLAAGIMLYVMCEEGEAGGQIYTAATTGDQAKIVFRIAKAMVEKSADLRNCYGIMAFALEIKRYATDSFFKYINAKASTQDGLNPQAFVLDELHAHKTHDLKNVLTDAAGSRGNPLFLYTTTEGFETPGPWPEERQFAKNILMGVVEADHYLAVIYSVDEEDKALGTKQDDDFDESKFRKANPLYDSNPILRDALRKLVIEVKQQPGKLGEFRIKRLNRQSSAAKTWIDILKWRQCDGPVDLQFLQGYPCWGAFDLASTADMAAWCLLWYAEGEWYCLVRYFVPQVQASQRAERRSVPYQAWIDAGHVIATEGDRIDYDVIAKVVMEDYRMFQPSKIAYDPWNAQQFVTNLTNEGLELEMFIQGPKSYNPAMQALDVAYKTLRLHHGGNPVLQWNAANLVPRYDVNLNMAPDKKRSADKIDGVCSVIMAFGLAAKDSGDDSGGFFEQPVAA